MTLYDAFMIYGRLADIFKVKFVESLAFEHSLKAYPLDSLNKKDMEEAQRYLVTQETITNLKKMRALLKDLLQKHVAKFKISKTKDLFSYKIEDPTEIESLQSIFSPEMNKALISNTFIQAAFQLRRAVGELLKNEQEFVTNCEKIRFDELSYILQKHEETDPSSEELRDINNLGKNYYSISNSLQMSIEELGEFCKNIFSICVFLHQKFISEDFQKSFSALEEITKNYSILLRRITNVQANLDTKDPDYIFLADFQAIIIQPVQRTMRYKLTLSEISKHCSTLLSDEADNLYIPLREKNGKNEISKNVVKNLIPNIINTIDKQVKNINIEVYLRECIKQINEKSVEIRKMIDPNPIFFGKEKNTLLSAWISCCTSVVNKTENAIMDKTHLSNHVLKEIVSVSVETVFSQEAITNIRAHGECKTEVLSFFDPLIRNGDNYYTIVEKTESNDSLRNSDANRVSLSKKGTKRDIDSLSLSTDNTQTTKKLKQYSEATGEEKSFEEVNKNKRAANVSPNRVDEDSEDFSEKTKSKQPKSPKQNEKQAQDANAGSLTAKGRKRAAESQGIEGSFNDKQSLPVVKKSKQEISEPGETKPGNSQSAPSRTSGTLFHPGSASSSKVEPAETATQQISKTANALLEVVRSNLFKK